MIYRIEIPWSERDKYKSLSLEDYQELKSLVLGLPDTNEDFYPHNSLVVDDEGLQALLKISPLELKKFKNTYVPNEKKGWIEDISEVSNITHVHIPNIGLLTINEVCVLENECTNQLQQMLEIGWRIIAVCPPNGTKRPDYIMGRTK